MFNTGAYTVDGGMITQSKSDGREWTNSQITPMHLDAGTYTITCSDGNTINFATSIDNYENITQLRNGGGTFTLAQGCDIKFKHSASSYPVSFTIQLELGSTATAYEPYGNAYGGYIDLGRNKLVATHGRINLKNKSWYKYTSNQFSLDIHKKLTSTSVFCDSLPISTTNGYPTDDKSLGFYSNGMDYCRILFIKYTDSNELSDFTTWLNNLEVDLCVVYELSTPIEYDLTPQQIKTFKGTNNIWSDANGNVEVKYWTH